MENEEMKPKTTLTEELELAFQMGKAYLKKRIIKAPPDLRWTLTPVHLRKKRR